MQHNRFISFKSDVSSIALPKRFTFPFYYEPHQLSEIAAQELQDYLQTQNDWQHNFGLPGDPDGIVIGKMFGVLVVRNSKGELGYIAAFSGKLANQNHFEKFVPPVFDILEEDGFYRQGEKVISGVTDELESLLISKAYQDSIELNKQEHQEAEKQLERLRLKLIEARRVRKIEKLQLQEVDTEDSKQRLHELKIESLTFQSYQKDMKQYWDLRLNRADKALARYEQRIAYLKKRRKQLSGELQNEIFSKYQFLNAEGEFKSLLNIFTRTEDDKPPAGAGECAAPKLLHYAYSNDLEPIALAEFWWGASPKSEIRQHQKFYPSCKGKCEPILGHMLQGLEVDENPMLVNPAEGKSLERVYEDQYIVVINKPAEFLSVPGKTITDSVYSRMQQDYPDATGPLIVHRLDMSTSGLLLIAKDKVSHKKLQRQFINRTIRKRYVALLEDEIIAQEGEIDLPLRVDLDDRPRQLVCEQYGKVAKTKFEVVELKDGKTKVYFYPITGRTHQLRVHAAHHLGLNAPIVGDDLYGTKNRRLHLHAEQLEFSHPITKERMVIQVDADF